MDEEEALAEAFQAICRMDAPLNARLQAYSAKLRQFAPQWADAYDQLVARLTSGEFGSGAPAVGDRFPSFVLPSNRGGLTTLEELLAQGPVVVSFNRGHWCPLCQMELRSLLDRADELSPFGAQLVSIIPDRQFAAHKLAGDLGGRIIVLSDIDNGYALSVGLALWLGDELRALMTDRGLHLDVFQGNHGWFVPLPATYVVARTGIVLARKVDPEFRTRMDMDDIVAALQTLEADPSVAASNDDAVGRGGRP